MSYRPLSPGVNWDAVQDAAAAGVAGNVRIDYPSCPRSCGLGGCIIGANSPELEIQDAGKMPVPREGDLWLTKKVKARPATAATATRSIAESKRTAGSS